MNREEFALMKERLSNFNMIDEYGMIDIEELARMFLGMPDEDEFEE